MLREPMMPCFANGSVPTGEVSRVRSTRPTPRSTPAGARPAVLDRRHRSGGPGHPSSPASTEAYAEIADAVITLDTEGKILSVNPTAERILGHGATVVVGKPLSAFVCDYAGSYDVVCELVTDRRDSLVVILRAATGRRRNEADEGTRRDRARSRRDTRSQGDHGPDRRRGRFRAEGYQAGVGAPLIAGPQIMGALVVATAADRIFTEDDSWPPTPRSRPGDRIPE